LPSLNVTVPVGVPPPGATAAVRDVLTRALERSLATLDME
jgi:hypothetical protein